MAASTLFRRALGIVRRGLWVVVLVSVVLLVLLKSLKTQTCQSLAPARPASSCV